MDFRKATIEDLDVLVTTRIEVLRAANGLGADSVLHSSSYDFHGIPLI